MTRLVLASGSRFKREQLARLGLPFEAVNADVDESALEDEAPEPLSRRLATKKALALRERFPDAYILGADQVVSLRGEQLHKPGSPERALAQLMQLQGKTHDIFCAVSLVTPAGEVLEEVAHVEMVMRALDEQTLRRYVMEDDVLDSAGAYVIEAGGIRLFESMRCDDYTAIIGLPLTRVLSMLERAGALPALSSP